MNVRRSSAVVAILACLSVFALCNCATRQAIVIDTTAVDSVITDMAETTGTIETQTITIHDTVTKIIHSASDEEKALVEKQFSELEKSITYLKTLPSELARVHAVEIGKLSTEIARLQPYEVEAEKQKAGKWKAYSLLAILLVSVAGYVLFRVLK
jgi:hypothetical protein